MTTQIILTLLPKELAVRNNGGVLEVWVEQQSHPMNKSWQNSSGGYRRAMYSYRQGPDTQTSRRSNILCRVCCRQEKLETECRGARRRVQLSACRCPLRFLCHPLPVLSGLPYVREWGWKMRKTEGEIRWKLGGYHQHRSSRVLLQIAS